jgi:hypothetical protein
MEVEVVVEDLKVAPVHTEIQRQAVMRGRMVAGVVEVALWFTTILPVILLVQLAL